MAVIDTHHVPAISSILAGRFGAYAAALYTSFVGWNDARMTRRALSVLSDRELSDVGLCRGDIERLARSNGMYR